MMVKIIMDLGSTHMGKKKYMIDAIKLCKELGVDAIKFQLFQNDPVNISFPYSWFKELKYLGDRIGIEVFSSIEDNEGYETLIDCGCKSIKFAFSMNHSQLIYSALTDFDIVFVSGDVNTSFIKGTTRLFCIPSYPVQYMIDFENLFPFRFHGFSDHTLGINQTINAVKHGAKIIEKHMTLDYEDINCPDNMFALKPDMIKILVKKIRDL